MERAFSVLRARNETLKVTIQNFIEFWAVATRPAGSDNGLGMTTEAAMNELAILIECHTPSHRAVGAVTSHRRSPEDNLWIPLRKHLTCKPEGSFPQKLKFYFNIQVIEKYEDFRCFSTIS